MTSIKLITENGYAASMKNEVEPFLASLREDCYFESFSGGKIHYEKYILPDAKASVVIAHGFTESAEKFREMSYYFLKAGCNVFAIDHRGHGKSLRLNNDINTVHVDCFDDYIKDLASLVDDYVLPASGELPLYLYAHSMGGAIAVLYLEKYSCGKFKKCLLTAPMISAKTAGLPHSVAKAIAAVALAARQHKNRVIMTGEFNPNRSYENSNSTSRERFDYYHEKRKANDCYKTASPSYKWVWEALRIIPIMTSREMTDRIKIPVLLTQAETDGSVNLPPQNAFIKTLEKGRLIHFPKTRHEIFGSCDNEMKKYLDTIFDFFELDAELCLDGENLC